MNLKALYDLKERLEYSAIAGTGLLKEDFRLKRTVDNLAPLASASPVFAKISASAGKLLEASEKELSKQLLDVLSLVDAVIYTQGKKIVPLLKDGFEPCGKKDMVRRAMLIRELAGVDENDWYIKILPETQKEILEIIIKALGEDSNNEKLILELYNTEKGKAKEAVLYALAKINSQDGKYTPLELSHLIDFQNVLVGKYSAQVYDLWIWIAEQMSKFNNMIFGETAYLNCSVCEILQITMIKTILWKPCKEVFGLAKHISEKYPEYFMNCYLLKLRTLKMCLCTLKIQ